MMMQHGEHMAEGAHMMGGMGFGMMVFGLIYIVVVAVFLWLMYRGVVALEEIAENKERD
jgi:uncharacterized membrane protein